MKPSSSAFPIQLEKYQSFGSGIPLEFASLRIRNPEGIDCSYGMEIEILTNGQWSVWKPPTSACVLGQSFVDHTMVKDEDVVVPAGPITWRLQMQVWEMHGEFRMKLDAFLERLHLSSDRPDFVVYSQPFVKTNSYFRLPEVIREL